MDCEKFDNAVVSALYDELDELTLAALRRHADGCMRCQTSWTALRATKRVASVPMLEMSVELTSAILARASKAQEDLPWPKRLGRGVSWAAGYAMRPQTAMAALLLLMVGSSLLFLRAKPDRSAFANRLRITEHGMPESVQDDVASGTPRSSAGEPSIANQARSGRGAVPTESKEKGERMAKADPTPFAAPPPASPLDDRAREGNGASGAMGGPAAELDSERSHSVALGQTGGQPADDTAARSGAGGPASLGVATDDKYSQGMSLYRSGRYAEATSQLDQVDPAQRNAPSAALYAAKAAEASRGCAAALPRYEQVTTRFEKSSSAAEAQFGSASCYRTLGRYDKARQAFLALRSVAGYRDRAESELSSLALAEVSRTKASAGSLAKRSEAASAKPAQAAGAAEPAAPAPAGAPARTGAPATASPAGPHK